LLVKVEFEHCCRRLEEIPGMKKAGYGEWTYASDETPTSRIYDPTEGF